MSYNEDNHRQSIIGSLISGLIAIVVWYYIIKALINLLSFLFEVLIEFSKFLAKLIVNATNILYQTTSGYIQKRKSKFKDGSITILEHANSTTFNEEIKNSLLSDEINKKLDAPSRGKLNYAQSITEFRAKYPFVKLDVHPVQQTQFINECEWLKNKIGHFPSEAEQHVILKSLDNVTE